MWDRASTSTNLDIRNLITQRNPYGHTGSNYGPTLAEFCVPNAHWTQTFVRINDHATACAVCEQDGATFSPEQRAVITQALNEAPYDFWKEPLWQHIEYGLNSVYFDAPQGWRKVAGMAADQPFQPGQVFGGNLRALVAHVGFATEQGASLQDVLPALQDYLAQEEELSQAQLSSKHVSFLLCAIVAHKILKLPPKEARRWIYDFIMDFYGIERPTG